MSIRSKRSKWSTGEWSLRIVLAVAVSMLCVLSMTFSLAQTLVKTMPDVAVRLAPYDGRINASASARLSGPEATPTQRKRSELLGNRALRQDATAAIAAATLGVDADFRGKQSSARRLFAYAHKLSRRDVRTQLWMIEDAVGRGSIADALREYDVTLRVFPGMDKVLYPVLTAAAADAAVRAELAKTLASKPLWGENFIGFASSHSPDPQSIALLFDKFRQLGGVLPEIAASRLINTLFAAGNINAAWGYYASIRSGTDRRRSRDPKFSTMLATPSRFDWVANEDPGLATSISNGVFDFSAPASVGGLLLQQSQMLPAGEYHLIGHSIGVDQADAMLPYWVLRCTNGLELGRVRVPNSAQANGTFAGNFVVPVGCLAQTLELVAQPSDAIAGVSGQIDRVELAPAR